MTEILALSDRGAGVPLRELALVGLTAAIITYLATGWVRLFATRVGALAYPRERDVHLRPTPRMGGLAIYVGVVPLSFWHRNCRRLPADSSTRPACRQWSLPAG